MNRPERPPTVGDLVGTWQRRSQTVVLRAILAVKRLGVAERIVSITAPDRAPSHGDMAHVGTGLTYLALRRPWTSAWCAIVPRVRDAPAPSARTLLAARRYRRCDVVRRLSSRECRR